MRKLYSVFKALPVFLLLSFCVFTNTYAQKYGLGFSSHEVFQDKRTSLDLTPEKPLYFNDNTELSFDFSLFPNHITYFGYIVRIIEDDNRNIDLVYNAETPNNHIDVIIGERLLKSNFLIDPTQLYKSWRAFKIKFDFEKDKLTISNGAQVFTQTGLHLKKGAAYKVLFGTNNYKRFQTTDVPPMKLRDIKVLQNGILQNYWPLNEISGTIAHETIAQKDAVVVNPVWISALHQQWQHVPEKTVNGIASIAFDPKTETLYAVGADSVFSYSIGRSVWVNTPNQTKINLIQGNQSVYNHLNNGLYNIFPDLQFISKYAFDKHTWDKYCQNAPVTQYWHMNKFISSIDTSLYTFGGYGQLLYKNSIMHYSFASNKWSSISHKGDFFMPRYLAALGTTAKGDTAYIMGGYGNKSGKQILNPKNIYDLMRFTVKDQTFKKLYEIKVDKEDFAFANSLVIDDKSKTFCGLIFPQHKYNSNLQMISGSLSNPDYHLLANKIPYNFHDVHSFADLYYCPSSNKFIAVTLLRTDNDQTKINIYTLLGPPEFTTIQALSPQSNKAIYLAGLIALLIASAGVMAYKARANKKDKASAAIFNAPIATNTTAIAASRPVGIDIAMPATAKVNETRTKNTIFLFGDLQVFDADGTDITKHFTPLIKELFLLILLYSIRKGRGLSSEKLNEILWSDKTAKSARNNRSVNITKLKTLLDKMGYCQLSKETGYWKIDIDHSHIYVDYASYLNIVKDKKELDRQKIQCLSAITQRGNFLSNIEYEWLDTFKSEISNEVIDTYLHFAQSAQQNHQAEFLVEMANYIFYFDPVNEEAMILKCKALSALGKHSLAKHTFESFIKEYKVIYDEDFKKDFHAVLE